MTREELIQITREIWGFENWSDVQLSRFERLVAIANAEERQRIAQAIEDMPFGDTSRSFAIFVRNFK